MLKINIQSNTRNRRRLKRDQLSNRIIAGLYAVLMLIFPLPWTPAQAHEVLLNAVADVYFSPKGGCTKAIVSEINRAKSEILVQAYSFTSNKIVNALANAHTRGVSIQLILDKSQRTARRSIAAYASRTGIPTFIDRAHAIAHNKVMIIDKLTVITGSFNFTKAAEEGNAENLLIVRSSALAQLYGANWNQHRRHSDEYSGRDTKMSQRN